MKFYEFLDNNKDFWQTISGYPEIAKSQIQDWFYYRVCCTSNNDKFKLFLTRKLNIINPQFTNLWEAQAKLNFEPGTLEKVETTIDYIKEEGVKETISRVLNGTETNTGTNTNVGTRTGNDTTTDTRNLTDTVTHTGTQSSDTSNIKTDNTTVNTSRSGTEKIKINTMRTDNLEQSTNGNTTETGSINVTDTRTENSDDKVSDYPQSTPTGFENYISAETKHTGDSSGTNGTERDLTTNSTNTVSNTGTQSTDTDNTLTRDLTDTTHNTGTTEDDTTSTLTLNTEDKTVGTGTLESKTEYNTETNDTLTLNTSRKTETDGTDTRNTDLNNKANTVISTLRTGNLEEAFQKYFNLAINFNAISWLIGQLDECFIQIYDCEETEEQEAIDSGAIKKLQEEINALKVDVDNVYLLTENNTDDINRLSADVDKNKQDIIAVGNVASENSAELVSQNERINNLVNKLIKIKSGIPFVLTKKDGTTETVNLPSELNAIISTDNGNINRLKIIIPSYLTTEVDFSAWHIAQSFTLNFPYNFRGMSVSVDILMTLEYCPGGACFPSEFNGTMAFRHYVYIVTPQNGSGVLSFYRDCWYTEERTVTENTPLSDMESNVIEVY